MMRDPKLDMYINARTRPQTVEQMGRNIQAKSARVSFEPQVEVYDAAPTDSRAPSMNNHHSRSQTVTFQGNGHIDVSNTPVSGATTPAEPTRPGLLPLRSARPTPTLVRAKSEHWIQNGQENGAGEDDGEDFELRHGWQEEYTSSEYLKLLNSNFYMYFNEKRHDTGGFPKEQTGLWLNQDWRMRDRLKTVSAALAICLNIGVDPPDVVKTNPSAKLECWVDPTSSSGAQNKVMEQIGKKLQEQYETLSLRTRYKQYLDPSVEETKKFCISLRRNAKDERVLFHYNGHGVPLPTPSGEIWVFNKTYTQYIPVSLYDLQSWLAGPSLFVFDVSHAGHIVTNFHKFVEKHEKENAEVRRKDSNAAIQNYGDCIILAACDKTESLPTNPDLPADLFTCCLTTPIQIALRYFMLQNPLQCRAPPDEIKVPGRLQDRRSPLGELNWIFTAITDTIAWNTLPRSLFKKLFRQDLMVAALFRNFLLSERIMRTHDCCPISSPELPETHTHPLWQSWDLAIEMVLSQLPALLEHEEGKKLYEYQHSSFFSEQLTAFEVYLSAGPTESNPPDQLPIVLQVLLSQAHRLRALILLSKFLDLGPWAVHLALSIGIFPYVVKLLQSAAQELKPVMVFIWARIMAVDHTVQSDLLKDNGIHYFINILNPGTPIPVGNVSEHRAMCAFIVAVFCKEYPQGQNVCLSPELIEFCLHHLTDTENPLLRQWCCLCLSMLWLSFPEAKWMGIRSSAPSKLCKLVLDPVPEVRAAMLHALTSFIGIPDLTDQIAQTEEYLATAIVPMGNDGSVLVRKELLVFLSTFAKRYQNKFLVAAYEQLLEEKHLLKHIVSGSKDTQPPPLPDRGVSHNTIHGSIWRLLLITSVDPQEEVAQEAATIVDYVYKTLLDSPMGTLAQTLRDEILELHRRSKSKRPQFLEPVESKAGRPDTPSQVTGKPEGYFSLSLRRTVSVAASLKNLAFGVAPAGDQRPSSPLNPPGKAMMPKGRMTITPRGRAPPEWTRPPEVNDQPVSAGQYGQAPAPPSRNFKTRDLSQELSIPLKSKFLDWSTEYFREPQMKPSEPDEPGSADYNQRLWRRARNERIIFETQQMKDRGGNGRWDITSALMPNPSQPAKMCFHQFEDHLAVADDRDTICIWDWQRNSRLNRFSNGNPLGSRINEVRFINEDDQALLMTGSSDGVLKIFRNYESDRRVELITAFRALPELIPSNKNAGLVLDWQQGQGKALVAGDVKVIRVWNAATEVCTTDISARSGSCITSLTSDQVAGNIFIAGFGDGAVRVFDQRLKTTNAMVKVWREHKQWITNVHMQRGGVRELISGSRNGEVKLWDLRMDSPLDSIQSTKDTLRTLSVHEHAPVFTVGTNRHEVKTFNVDGTYLSSFEPHGSFLHHSRTSPVVGTAFHPHRMVLACSTLYDNYVNLVTC
ncbi:Target of rapamycin complex 1 subunit kog1 [Ophidiomyces ophidiicola]|nr:Target of rapamycin complex 1 subunit kog1 [Ophidiomyces ophidiicola]